MSIVTTALPGIQLAVDNVSFSYPDGTRALTDVSVAIGAGDRVAIVGQNGSGKSTLVRHFNGLLRPTVGRVLVGAKDIARTHVADLARHVGISFQNPDRQIFSARVKAEIAFGARNVRLTGADRERAVSEALAAVGLSGHADSNPYDLGFSERKLLALASILAMRTPAVILDEPTTGQDRPGAERVIEIVRALSAAGRTVVAISHDMAFVAEAFERVVVMRGGRIILDAPTNVAFAEQNWPILETTFLEAPYPARLGAGLGLGSTPTQAAFVKALVARSARNA